MAKVQIVCSNGGHLNEALAIAKHLNDHQVEIVTYESKFTEDLTNEIEYDVRLVSQSHVRLYDNRLRLAKHLYNVTIDASRYLNDDFDCVISTGSEIAIPFLLIAKLRRIPFIFVESLSRTDELSGTGKIAYKFADTVLVQWEALAEKYPRVEYHGRVV
ncbi:PssD/Cps14F family polysaccharide biosynthesis glycosyltransferase [Haloferax sp. DFSO52]|uniref:PssD/Cps14F family polysaccharide biosynthesis glycosyltransferase n=1 Tax=Haloferax sp. DFSO52 TaxID=3388505 RepID=UPI003A86A9FD